MNIFLLIVAVLALLLLGVQVWARIKAGRMRGSLVPRLEGKLGRVLESGKPALIYFHSPGCRACSAMTPMVRDLQKERDDVFEINAAAEMETARAFGIMATPTTVSVSGGRVVDVVLGPRPREAFLALFGPEST